MKHFIIYIIALMLITTISCNKNKNKYTYYFNCYIDGQYFEPEKQQGLGEYPLTAKLLYNETDLRIDVSKGLQNIFIVILDSIKVKEQVYQLTNTPYSPQAVYDNNLSVNDFRTDSIRTGFIRLSSLDKINQVVEGTFYFNAYNATLNDTIHITDGKFKLKYTLQ